MSGSISTEAVSASLSVFPFKVHSTVVAGRLEEIQVRVEGSAPPEKTGPLTNSDPAVENCTYQHSSQYALYYVLLYNHARKQ